MKKLKFYLLIVFIIQGCSIKAIDHEGLLIQRLTSCIVSHIKYENPMWTSDMKLNQDNVGFDEFEVRVLQSGHIAYDIFWVLKTNIQIDGRYSTQCFIDKNSDDVLYISYSLPKLKNEFFQLNEFKKIQDFSEEKQEVIFNSMEETIFPLPSIFIH